VETPATPSASATPQKRITEIDTLLPPGAGDALPSEITPATEVALPEAPRKPAPLPTNLPEGALVVPTPEGGYATIRKKAKKVGSGEDEVELRELTPEEKAKKRLRYNLIMWSVCFLILFVVFLVLAWPALFKR